jgi:cellulose synthase/poly-beta-1,6-N-acetylglucosamine synthase-like glycosyltransferase
MDSFALGTAIIAAIALGIALTAAGCAVAFLMRMLVPREVPNVPVTLVLAATGPLPGLEALFDALLGQTLRPARLLVAVESRDDPAHDRIEALARSYPALPIELVVAGISGERAQKCTNLLAALARLRPADSYIVLIDADIRPQPWWLAALVAPLAAGRADIVNGYRWQTPQAVSLAAAIGATIDRAIATMPRLDRLELLWGGSLAMTREALDRIDMPTTLAHALTEDLVIADRAAALGLRVLTRRGLRVPTPLGDNLAALWRFGRRQYQITHVYRPVAWWFAAAVTAVDVAARAGLVAAASTLDRIALGALITLGLLGTLTAGLRRAIGRRLGVADPAGFVVTQYLLVWLTLPLAAFHASLVWAAAVRSPVTWAHVRYTVRGGRVVGASRQPTRPVQPGLRATSRSSNE